MTGTTKGKAAMPRSIAVPPYTPDPSTKAGRKITQSSAEVFRCASAAALVRENIDGPAASAPNAEIWTTRRMPARAQPSNKATVPAN